MLLSLSSIKSKYKNFPTKVLHLGAHLGEEANEYHKNGITDVIWIEGNTDLIEKLNEKLEKHPLNSKIYNVMISLEDKKELNFNITDFDQSSSVLELGLTEKFHKTKIIKSEKVVGRRLENFFFENTISLEGYRFLAIDLQGYELQAIKSMGMHLNNFDFIMTEVNLKELYKECTLITHLDHYLKNFGFVREKTTVNENFWGDALYVRHQNKSKLSHIFKIQNLLNIQYYLAQSNIKNLNRSFKNLLYNLYYKIKK